VRKTYKSLEFQEKHKYALIKILLEEHKKYKKNNFIIDLPNSIKERTQNYLDLSFTIVKWFKETYEHTKDKSDTIKIKDLYSDFTESQYFYALTKHEKQKYNKSYFNNYIETNTFFKKYYVERLNNIRNIIQQWKKIDDSDSE